MLENIKLFIFDLDGVLTETSEQHYQAWKTLANNIGIDFDREFNEKLKGISRMESLELILKHGNFENKYTEDEKLALAETKNTNYLEMIDAFTSENLFEGVRQLFLDLRERGIKVAIGSASKNAPMLIEKMDVADLVDYIVDPSSVPNGKPAPDIFLKAAEHFNLKPEECVGVEDAEAGVQAIKSAGMFAIGIGDRTILNKADIVVPETKDININNL